MGLLRLNTRALWFSTVRIHIHHFQVLLKNFENANSHQSDPLPQAEDQHPLPQMEDQHGHNSETSHTVNLLPNPLTSSKVSTNIHTGTIIDRCTTPGKIALTYDDGPSEWTPQLLDILSSLNVKATFFITGLGSRASITDPIWANVIRRTYNEGHQIGNHGWAHLSLPSLSYDAQRSEITTNENALQGILGFIPTYYRCPYLDCNSASGLPILNELGYHVISVNADTKDYLYDSPDQIYNAMDAFSNQVSWNPGQDSYINLAHDIRYQTVVSLTKFMIETARARGYQLVTVGECLGDSRENWYRGGGSVARSTPPTTRNPGPALQKVISPNGLCAGSDGHTCQESKFGDCCSEWGYWYVLEPFLFSHFFSVSYRYGGKD